MKRLIILSIILATVVLDCEAIYYKISDYQSGGRMVALEIDNNYIYSAKYHGLIEIINISNPAQPQLVGSIQIPDIIPGVRGRIIISDTLAFILGQSKIHIINTKHPTVPSYEGNLDYGNTSDLVIDGNIIYIAGNTGFYILDISDIQSPQMLGSLYSKLDGICLNDTIIYGVHSGGPNSLHIISIADNQNPIIINNNINLSIGTHADIGFINEHVYITNSHHFWSIAVNDPTTPTIVDTLKVEQNSNKLFIQNNKAIINNSSSGIKIIDISDPTQLSSLGYYDTSGSSEQVVVNNDIAYIATSYSGLNIIDIQDHTNPSLVSSFQTNSLAQGIGISGEFAYLVDKSTGLDILDFSNITNPVLTGTHFNGLGNSDNVSVKNNKLCFSQSYPYRKLLFIDITTPDVPSLLHQIDLPEVYPSRSIALFQTNSYVFAGIDDTLHIYNVSDFNNPILIAKHVATSNITDIFINKNKGYLSVGENGIEIIDIENINFPQLVGSYNTSGFAKQVTCQDTVLLIADGKSGLQIINVSDPTSPYLLANIKPHYNSNIIVKPIIIDGKMIIVDKEWNEIFTYNINDFNNPQLLSSFRLNTEIYSLIHKTGVFFCSIKYYGLIVLKESCILSINEHDNFNKAKISLNVYPNPFRNEATIRFSLIEGSFINIEIINQYGIIVKSLLNEFKNTGIHQVNWKGLNNNNNKVKAGVYIVKIKFGNKTEYKKVILI